jgi:hypothetical protein
MMTKVHTTTISFLCLCLSALACDDEPEVPTSPRDADAGLDARDVDRDTLAGDQDVPALDVADLDQSADLGTNGDTEGDADVADVASDMCLPIPGDALGGEPGAAPTECLIPCLENLFHDCRPAGTCRTYTAPYTWITSCFSNGVVITSGTNHGSAIIGSPDHFVYKPDHSLCYTVESDGCGRRLYRDGTGKLVATELQRNYRTVAVLCGDQRFDTSSILACESSNMGEGLCQTDSTCSAPLPQTTPITGPTLPN